MWNDEYLQARELVNLSSCDKWLLNRIQTYDFDGTWVSIICGLYQSLYFYRTEIVEEHLLSCRLSNHLVLPKAKVMVLLLRWQHLQKFQRLVTERLLESYPANMKIQIIEMLSLFNRKLDNIYSSYGHPNGYLGKRSNIVQPEVIHRISGAYQIRGNENEGGY
jgi:hypothetical protein